MASTAQMALNGTETNHSNGTLPDLHATSSAATPVGPKSKKAKAKPKKAVDSAETKKLLAAKINQLEQGAAEEKDQELEIGAFFRILCAW